MKSFIDDHLQRITAGLPKNRRYVYPQLVNYLDNPHSKGRVCILYGLKRGKSFLMGQLMSQSVKESAYILCDKDDKITEIYDHIIKLGKLGKRIFCIDEATKIKDFASMSSIFSDGLAMMNYKIILSGTHSLLFKFTEEDEFFDRVVWVPTTYFGYEEFCKLVDDISIDEYIKYGGVFPEQRLDGSIRESVFDHIGSTNKYIYLSIQDNIVHAVKNNKDNKKLRFIAELDRDGELHNAIGRILNPYSQELITELLFSNDFINEDFKQARENMAKRLKLSSEINIRLLYDLDFEKINEEF